MILRQSNIKRGIHFKLIHSKTDFECHICGRCFKIEDDLVAHQKHFHEEENQGWHCNDCTYEANTQTNLTIDNTILLGKKR